MQEKNQINNSINDTLQTDTNNDINRNSIPPITIIEKNSNSKKKYQFDKIDFIFSIITLWLGNLYIEFVLTSPQGLGFVLFTIAFLIVSLSYLYAKKKVIEKKVIPFCIVTILASLPLMLYEQYDFTFMSTILTATLAVYTLAVATNVRIQDKIGDFIISDLYNSFIFRPFNNFSAQFNSIFKFPKKSKNYRNIFNILIAIIITLLITLFTINILCSVDDNFYKTIQMITNYNIGFYLNINIINIILTLLISSYLFAMFYSSINNHNVGLLDQEKLIAKNEKKKIIPGIMYILPMITLSIVYLIFFISHIATLTQVFNSTTVVYSQYARQGFFELCQISALNLLLILSICFCKKNKKESKIISVLSLILGIATLLIMITACIKLGLYINIYGLTAKRIHASWVLFIIFITFIFLIIKQFKNINFYKYVCTTIVISYIILSLLGVNKIVAQYNYNNIITDVSHDYNYPYEDDYLRTPAFTPYLIKALSQETNPTKKRILSDLLVYGKYHEYSYDEFSSFNLERYYSDKIIKEYLNNTNYIID